MIEDSFYSHLNQGFLNFKVFLNYLEKVTRIQALI